MQVNGATGAVFSNQVSKNRNMKQVSTESNASPFSNGQFGGSFGLNNERSGNMQMGHTNRVNGAANVLGAQGNTGAEGNTDEQHIPLPNRLANMSTTEAADAIANFSSTKASGVLSSMDSTTASNILSSLSPASARSILDSMPTSLSSDLGSILPQQDNPFKAQ